MASDEIIYHYCDLQGFLGIVSNKEIWLTNIFFMNDSEEHLWLRRMALCELEKLRKTTKGGDRALIKWLESNLAPSAELTNIYCACFSKERDSLGQWRSYADDGRAVSVGFRREYLKALEPGLGEQSFYLFDVIYDEAAQLEIVKKVVEGIKDSQSRVRKRANSGFARAIRRQLPGAASRGIMRKLAIWREAMRCKNPAFREEQEVRAVLWGSPDYIDARVGQLRFRAKGNTIVPYYALKLLPGGEQAIREIVLGPKCDPRTENVAKLVLEQNGFDVKAVEFIKSKASYR